MEVTSINLPGFQLLELLYSGSRTVVYRGIRTIDQCPVAIKLLKNPYPSFSELIQFRNQYTISLHLDHPGIIRPYSLETYQNGYALVMEDFGGISLKEEIEKKPESLMESLRIAITLCDILHYLYQQRVLHKDIKPANILIHSQTRQIKLIDFSIASLLPRETQNVINPSILEGTLAYLSPEQTGRMNRGIDYRTDFYCFGVTLFELLTGQLPFQSDDPMELVHSHIAKQPPLVCDLCPEIPLVIAKIVAKLMEKNAEDRYRSFLGLKHDLQQCLSQLISIGEIKTFTIAQRDVSGHFLIPEKLYGRKAEVEKLLAGFERVADGATELMLVSGFSGIGKTAVVNEVHKPIIRQRGYFIKGKFDQFNRNIPLSAFVRAFRDLIKQLLSENDSQLLDWKTKILNALGENGQVMIEVIPELEHIIGKQQPLTELSGSAAQNRFNFLFQKFIQVFTSRDHPLVVFLDDLQWADLASLKLMQLLVDQSQQEYLLLIGAYRDNEVSSTHLLTLTLDEMAQTGAIINNITLAPLSSISLNQLVADTLNCTTLLAQPLTELIYQKTQGNPFFSTQFLKALYEDGLINFEIETGHWLCDIAQVRQLTLTDDVVEFMSLQLQKLPDNTQNALKLAACIGDQFDLATLAIISEQSQVEAAANVWKALQEGLVIPTNEIYKFYQDGTNDYHDLFATSNQGLNINYRFLHDRVQQAAYILIAEDQKQATHVKIGRLLLKNTDPEQRDEKIFDIVNQLNAGIEIICESTEREELAWLNLRAGQKSKASTAYKSAFEYFIIGKNLLSVDSWIDSYELTLLLYNSAAEAAYLSGNFEVMEQLSAIVLKQSRTLLDKVKIYDTQIQSYAAKNDLGKAIDTALEILELFDIKFAKEFRQSEIQQIIADTMLLWAGKSPISLIDLPQMTAEKPLAIMQIISVILPFAYQVIPELFIVMVLKLTDLSLRYGNTNISSDAYSCYGLVLCYIVGEIESGFEFGELSLLLLEKLSAKQLKAKPLYVVSSMIKHWKSPVQSTLKPLLEAYTIGLENGDFPTASWAGYSYCFYSYFIGKELTALERELFVYSTQINNIKQQSLMHMNEICRQAILNLMGLAENPCSLQGDAYDERVMLPLHQETNNKTLLFKVYFQKLILCCLFNNVSEALENAELAEQYLNAVAGYLDIPLFHFYDSLAMLAGLSQEIVNEQKSLLDKVAANQEKIAKWAAHAPMNYQHKFDLVEAERYRILGQKADAIEMYDRAIAGAKENGYLPEEALANELAAKFYLEWHKEKTAQAYIQDAYYCYARWSAKAKINDLEQRYPQFLRSILQPGQGAFNSLETLSSLNNATFPLYSSFNQTSTASNTISDALDFAAVLKASHSLSSIIQLDELIHTLTRLIMENSGAQKCVLIMPKDNNWVIEAIASCDQYNTPPQTLRLSQALESSHELPIKVIQYVRRTLEVVLIDNINQETKWAADVYLIQNQPKSFFCIPVLNQGQLVAILYLEHRLSSGVFTIDRVQVVNFLCTQAAISLENARLYQQTQSTLTQLQYAQLQLVQSEKMSALGNLVAGIAHEINNPVAFISGNLSEAKIGLQNLMAHLELYRSQAEPAEILNHAEEIYLDYLLEDMPKMIDSMQVGCDRIKNISTSLRTFSRADTTKKIAANIHEGIDSSLMILQHRLKNQDYRPNIQVVKQYGNLPKIKCFLGQLSQVFMNILANAIDAIDESCYQKSFAELKANPKQIVISTEVIEAENAILIRIQDNGLGMPEDVKAQIFNHLFTTKEVGKGTGLGLSIARQIVEQAHDGQLSVTSVMGQGTEFIIKLPLEPE
jgi:predicted ATPase/signal transduction histidine kinase